MSYTGGWTIFGAPLDIRDPRIIAMAAAQRHFLEGEYNEYAAANPSGTSFCRSAALIEEKRKVTMSNLQRKQGSTPLLRDDDHVVGTLDIPSLEQGVGPSLRDDGLGVGSMDVHKPEQKDEDIHRLEQENASLMMDNAYLAGSLDALTLDKGDTSLPRDDNTVKVTSKVPPLEQEGELGTLDAPPSEQEDESLLIDDVPTQQKRKKEELPEGRSPANIQTNPLDDNVEHKIELRNVSISVQPSWTSVISLRAFVYSFLLTMTIVQALMNLFMTTGMSLPISQFGSLGGYTLINWWMKLCTNSRPLSKHEHIVIRTCVVTSSAIILGAGYAIFLVETERAPSESLNSIKQHIPILRMIIFLLLISYSGFCYVLCLWKKVIPREKLSFQNAVTIAAFIRRFHGIDGEEVIRKQIFVHQASSIAGLIWGIIKWIISKKRNCGFTSIPTFGRNAYKHKFKQ